MDLTVLERVTLAAGAHRSRADGTCAMEAVAWIAGEPHSDHPECVCPVIAAFMRRWNDCLPDGDRDRLLLPLLPLTIGTRSTPGVQDRRAFLAADWAVRVFTPAWLRLAGLDGHADALAGLPEVVDVESCRSARPVIDAARVAAGAAAWDAAGDAARVAAGDAARVAAGYAAGYAARDAAGYVAGYAAGDAAWAAAWAAAWVAARVAAGDAARVAAGVAAGDAARVAAGYAARTAAGTALAPTVTAMQASAQDLVRRMCEVTA